MYLHDRKRLIYLAHPRTASRATAKTLQMAGFRKTGATPVDHHSGLEDRGSPVNARNRKQWTVFTTVRNPWDVAVSWVFWQFRSAPKGEPEKWDVEAFRLSLDCNRWRRENGPWWPYAEDADVILRFERLKLDLTALLSRHGLAMPRIRRSGSSQARRGRHYREFYCEETRTYIAERFVADIERFGYAF